MNEREPHKREVIVITGVEGGGVTLYGERTDQSWRFYSDFVDQTPLMLAEIDEQREIRRESLRVDTWEDALKLLDQMGWLRLPAIAIHKEFRQKVWDAVQARLDNSEKNTKKLERWRERCGIAP